MTTKLTTSHEELRPHLRAAFTKCMRNLRRRAEISQERLAAVAGVDRGYYGQLERGLHGPSLETIFRLIPHLAVDFVEFAQQLQECLAVVEKESAKTKASAKKAAAAARKAARLGAQAETNDAQGT